MQSFVLTVLALSAPAVPVADATPKEVVMRFLALAQREKWDVAATMLTPDAQLGVNDVGGPLNAETLPTLAGVYKAPCSLRDAIETSARAPERPDMRFVETRWFCPKRKSPATPDMTITFFVQGEKLAGYYIG